MMALLFAIYGFCLWLAIRGKRRQAFFISLINLGLMVLMLIHHATSVLQIRL